MSRIDCIIELDITFVFHIFVHMMCILCVMFISYVHYSGILSEKNLSDNGDI